MTTLVFHDDCLKHHPGFGHPELPARLIAIKKVYEQISSPALSLLYTPLPATEEQITTVHTKEHFQRMREICFACGYHPGMESNLNPDSWNAALLSAGAGVQAVDKVIAGEWDNAFCAVRPPGHHSTSNQALGFCMFNNIAITAAYALKKGLSKILIVDWDVHHGNGTQDIFYRSSQVFFYSMHQHNLYPPFSGQESDDGEGEGEGFTLNRPLKPGTPGNLQVEIFIQDLEEITRSFHPQLVLISCGFDSCDGDLLGSLKLEKSHYAQMTAEVLKIVPGKVISFLEGGYNLQLIGDMFGAHFSTLMGKYNAC